MVISITHQEYLNFDLVLKYLKEKKRNIQKEKLFRQIERFQKKAYKKISVKNLKLLLDPIACTFSQKRFQKILEAP